MRQLCHECAASRRPLSRRGFTLIEALATIVVLMVALPVIVQAFTAADHVAIRARQRAEATAIAQSAMEQIIAEQTWQNAPISGSEQHRDTVYQWSATVQEWPDAINQSTQVTNVQELDVTVNWNFENRPDQIVLSSLVWVPGSTITSSGTPVGEQTP